MVGLRPTGVTVSAIMQLLKVFGSAELREREEGARCRAGAYCCPALCSESGWGRRAAEKRGKAMRRGKIIPDSGFFFSFPSFLKNGLPVCNTLPLC